MDLLGIIGLILVILAVLHYIPLVLGLVLGIVLLLVGAYPRLGRGGEDGATGRQ